MKVREGYYSEQNRDEAFLSVLENLGSRQRAVYDIIKDNGVISNERIADILSVFPHQISPRVKELRELNLVEYAGDTINERSKRKASLWKIVSPDIQLKFQF
jgi:transcription initiation factor IIE alpha subunit